MSQARSLLPTRTGLSSLTAHNVLTGGSAGTALGSVAPGTNGNVLTSNGTDWTSAAAAGSSIAPLVIEDANTVAQRNGSNAQDSYIYGTYVSGSNYRRLHLGLNIFGAGFAGLLYEEAGASATTAAMAIGNEGGGDLFIRAGATAWKFKNAIFEFQPAGDNDRDIGDPSFRVRTGYFGTSVIDSGSLTIGGGTAILKHLSATATLDFANLAAIGCEDLTIAVTGASLGDTVALGVPNGSVVANGTFTGWVSAADTVTIRFCTVVSGNPASGIFRADVWQH